MEVLAVLEAAAGEEDGEIFRGVAAGVAGIAAEESATVPCPPIRTLHGAFNSPSKPSLPGNPLAKKSPEIPSSPPPAIDV